MSRKFITLYSISTGDTSGDEKPIIVHLKGSCSAGEAFSGGTRLHQTALTPSLDCRCQLELVSDLL